MGKSEPGTRKFNERYLELVDHYGVIPQTIQVNKPNENGDVESANGVLKSRVRQHLLLRGSSDFESVDDYRYKEDLFPDVRFREAYDKLLEKLPQRRADIKYLQILKYAAHYTLTAPFILFSKCS